MSAIRNGHMGYAYFGRIEGVGQRHEPEEGNVETGQGFFIGDYEPVRHSGFGIASFTISVLVAMFDFFLLALAGIVGQTSANGIGRESWVVVVVGLFLLFGLGMSLLGIELGITGLIQRDRKRAFPILGLVLNSAIAVVLVVVVVSGVRAF